MLKKILVIIREIWDTRDLVGEMLDASGNLKVERLETRMEPEDLNALEMALKIHDAHNTPVTVVSLGDPIRVDVLRESLYRGADSVIRLKAEENRPLDTLGRARLLTAVVEKKGPFDLILVGLDVPEGENSQVGSHLASLLGMPQVTYVDNIESIDDTALTVRRAIEGGIQSVRVHLPAVLTVGVALTQDDPRTPRTARARLKLQHKKTAIPAVTAAELGLSSGDTEPRVHQKGYESVPAREIHTVRIDGADEGALGAMIAQLRADRVL